MKKVLGILIITLFSTFNTNAEIISVGINGNVGMLDGDGKETFNQTTNTKSQEMVMGYISGFAELHVPVNIIPGQFRVGASYVPYSLESETNTSVHGTLNQAQGGTGEAARTQKIQVDIEDLLSYYVSYHYAGFFIKAGVIEGDLITNEKLDTGSAYPNASLGVALWQAGIKDTGFGPCNAQ